MTRPHWKVEIYILVACWGGWTAVPRLWSSDVTEAILWSLVSQMKICCSVVFSLRVWLSIHLVIVSADSISLTNRLLCLKNKEILFLTKKQYIMLKSCNFNTSFSKDFKFERICWLGNKLIVDAGYRTSS